jgi:thymidylate kinase
MSDEEFAWLEDLHALCRKPDVTYFLDVSVDECLRRIFSARKSKAEFFEKEELLVKVHAKYHEAVHLLRNRGEAIEIIDGEAPMPVVTQQILEHIAANLM